MFDDIFEDMKRLQKEINKSFGVFWENSNLGSLSRGDFTKLNSRNPLTDIVEKEDSLIVNIELPGVDKEDINLNITEDRVEVKVEKKQRTEIKEDNFYKREIGYSGFYRKISLPSEVIPEESKARYENGVLEITLPKKEKTKKKVEIKIE